MLIYLQLEAISTASTEGASWTALSDYDDRLPDTQLTSTSPTTVHSKGECSLLCQRQSGCNGFFFNDVSKTCLPVAVTMSYRRDIIVNGVTSTGYRYYSNGVTCPVPTMDSLVHVQSSSCFQVISHNTVRKNWTDARDACDSEGGRLAVLDTKDKMDVMRNNPDLPPVRYHLGAHRPMDRWNTTWPNGEPDFIWLNGQPLDLNLIAPYWLNGDPNNENQVQNIIMMWWYPDRPWVDDDADRIVGYICEFPLM
ncbi:hypothetical protein V1264_018237 [Littorina saxatilis]|uniref:C-type lectin domain-containing protein n=2 Tax=Littorina saxatilis TaxID=31220 RepID=A0AAN9GD83_9CAEN